jgi:hypothetical protein
MLQKIERSIYPDISNVYEFYVNKFFKQHLRLVLKNETPQRLQQLVIDYIEKLKKTRILLFDIKLYIRCY